MEECRFVSTALGAPSVVISGTTEMPVWCADSWDTPHMVAKHLLLKCILQIQQHKNNGVAKTNSCDERIFFNIVFVLTILHSRSCNYRPSSTDKMWQILQRVSFLQVPFHLLTGIVKVLKLSTSMIWTVLVVRRVCGSVLTMELRDTHAIIGKMPLWCAKVHNLVD